VGALGVHLPSQPEGVEVGPPLTCCVGVVRGILVGYVWQAGTWIVKHYSEDPEARKVPYWCADQSIDIAKQA
jgi:hypothetical protein